MIKNIEQAKEIVRQLDDNAVLIQEKTRENECEIAEKEEADYLVNFLGTHKIIEVENV